MKQPKKVLGIFTILCGLPTLLAVILLSSLPSGESAGFLGIFSFNLFTLSILINVVIPGFGGVIGGVMLYKGMEKGYYICAAVWLFFLLSSTYGLVTILVTNAIDTWGVFANIAIIKLVIVIVFSIGCLISLYKGFKVEPQNNNRSKRSDSVNAVDV